MKDRMSFLVLFALVATLSSWGSLSFADPIPICDQSERSVRELDPLKALSETAATSRMGGHGGRALSTMASSLAINGFYIREAGVSAGRLVVWIFEVSNPFAVAIGFIVDPSTTARCDCCSIEPRNSSHHAPQGRPSLRGAVFTASLPSLQFISIQIRFS
jgi:hypothetical protein